MILFLLIWSLTCLGFSGLAASMAKHQKQIFQAELSQTQSKQAMIIGWVFLIMALIICLNAGMLSNMISYWVGCLSFAAMSVAICLSYYAEQLKKFAIVCAILALSSAVLHFL
jgi:hypothetical protein